MQLHEALTQISEIRRQMAKTEVFRGYRSVTVGFSGLLAFLAAGLQPRLAPDPIRQLLPYLLLWCSVAVISMAAIAVEMIVRGRRSPMAAQLTILAVEQFLPCLVAGAMVTYVLAHVAVESAWMLPGLWAILFSLGAYASSRVLPRATFWAAGFYLIAGCLCLIYARGEASFSPWAMGLTFGCGQLLTAAILYWTLERHHA
jgi:hypothetical protein